MRSARISRFPLIIVSGLALGLLPLAAVHAGPPLICHPVEIAGAKSLPFGTDSWKDKSRGHSSEVLLTRTLEALSPEAPVLVRMETLRRATIYATDDPGLATGLLIRLTERVLENSEDTHLAALNWFDLGYLLEAYRQRSDRLPRFEHSSGYEWVLKARRVLANDPQIEFACALITSYPRTPAHDDHLKRALLGAHGDSGLADNLVSHFGQRGDDLQRLCARYGVDPRTGY